MKIITNCEDEMVLPYTMEPAWASQEPDLESQALWNVLQGGRFTRTCETPFPAVHQLLVLRESAQSQFAMLEEALKGGLSLPDGTATLALSGQNFQGQRDRLWTARNGNIHLCVYFRCDRETSDLGVGLTIVPSLAVIDAIRSMSPDVSELGIKWVNDILLGGRKVAGVLTSTQTIEKRVEQVVFGIGVNVSADPEVGPTPFTPQSGALSDLLSVPGLTLWDVLWPLLGALRSRYLQLMTEGPPPLIEDYRAHSVCLGERVKVWSEADGEDLERLGAAIPLADGRLETIHKDLSLQVEGCPEPITRGRLALAAHCAAFGL